MNNNQIASGRQASYPRNKLCLIAALLLSSGSCQIPIGHQRVNFNQSKSSPSTHISQIKSPSLTQVVSASSSQVVNFDRARASPYLAEAAAETQTQPVAPVVHSALSPVNHALSQTSKAEAKESISQTAC